MEITSSKEQKCTKKQIIMSLPFAALVMKPFPPLNHAFMSYCEWHVWYLLLKGKRDPLVFVMCV